MHLVGRAQWAVGALFGLMACTHDVSVTVRANPADLVDGLARVEVSLVESCDDQVLGGEQFAQLHGGREAYRPRPPRARVSSWSRPSRAPEGAAGARWKSPDEREDRGDRGVR